jgi:hypothetical protein
MISGFFLLTDPVNSINTSLTNNKAAIIADLDPLGLAIPALLKAMH